MVYGIVIKKNMNADNLIRFLSKKGIGSRNFFYPLHRQPILKKMGLFKNEKYPVSEKISKYGLYLPSGLALKSSQIKYISNILHKIKF